MGVGSPGKFLNIQHRQGGIGNGFPEHRLGIGPEGGVQLLLGAVRVQEGGLHAHPLHGHRQQVVAAAVNGGAGHHMVAAAGNIENRQEIGGLAGAGQHGCGAPLQGADLCRHRVAGGICQPGVKIALGLQVKKLSHILGGGVLVGRALNDGNLPGLPVARGIAGLNTKGFHVKLLVHCGHLIDLISVIV